MTRTSLMLGVVLATLGSACGPTTPPCSAYTCAGCCSAEGTCELGSAANQCGLGGMACTNCATSGQTCSASRCASTGSGGGGGGGGGGTRTGGGTGGGSGGGTSTTGGGTGGGTAWSLPCDGLDFDDAETSIPYGVLSENDVCVPINRSWANDRAAVRLRYLECLEFAAATAPGSGSYNVTRTGGRITSTHYTPSSGPSINQTFTYTNGRLTSWYQSYSDSTPSVSETASYTGGKLTSWRRSFSDSTPSVYETASYTIGQLTYWYRSFSDSTPSRSETLSYTSGRLTYFRRSYSDSTPSTSEEFSYTNGLVTYWRRSFSDSTPSASASISWSNGAISSLTTSGTGLSGLQATRCPVP